MTLLFKTFSVQSKHMHLFFDKTKPYIKLSKQTFSDVPKLYTFFIDNFSLEHSGELLCLCKGITFLLQGDAFEVIPHKNSFKLKKNPQTLSGDFDLETLSSPIIKDNSLEYYVVNMKNGLPYRVTVPEKYLSGNLQLNPYFELLPYL